MDWSKESEGRFLPSDPQLIYQAFSDNIYFSICLVWVFNLLIRLACKDRLYYFFDFSSFALSATAPPQPLLFFLLLPLLDIFLVVIVTFVVSYSAPSFPPTSKLCLYHEYVLSSLSPLEADLLIHPLIFFPLIAPLPLFLPPSLSLLFPLFSSYSFFLLYYVYLPKNSLSGMPNNCTAVMSTTSS